MRQVSCTSCGGALQIENQFIRVVVCPYCATNYLVSGGDTLAPGRTGASLVDAPSRLQIGARGALRGRGLTVLGRARYRYDGGFWDEWQVGWDDGAPPDWLEEDEGYWTLYRRERLRGPVPPPDTVQVGSTVQANTHPVFVTEKRRGHLEGTEGQFASTLPLRGEFVYIQGGAAGRTVCLTYWQDEIELSVGDDLDHTDLVLS
ncbi:MAG: DUF4178 domain-containing protein [Kineosporiaceae bacterium]